MSKQFGPNILAGGSTAHMLPMFFQPWWLDSVEITPTKTPTEVGVRLGHELGQTLILNEIALGLQQLLFKPTGQKILYNLLLIDRHTNIAFYKDDVTPEILNTLTLVRFITVQSNYSCQNNVRLVRLGGTKTNSGSHEVCGNRSSVTVELWLF